MKNTEAQLEAYFQLISSPLYMSKRTENFTRMPTRNEQDSVCADACKAYYECIRRGWIKEVDLPGTYGDCEVHIIRKR